MEKTNAYSSSTKALDVLIIGAGIGGLCAAIGLRQQGHHVTVIEKSGMAQEIGAAMSIAPNCNILLHRLGLDPRKHGSVELKGMTAYSPEGDIRFTKDFDGMSKNWQYPWDLIHRAHLHTALKELAVSSHGSGPRVKFEVGFGAERVDPETATVYLRDQGLMTGDLVIGADGVGSVSRKAIPGGDLKPGDSGRSAFRFLVPTHQLLYNEQTRRFFDQEGYMKLWVGADNKRIVAYPCDSGATMNVAAIFPSNAIETQLNGDLWDRTGDKQKMLTIFAPFGKDVAAMLDMAEEPKLWTLLDMQQMPAYAHKSFAVMGDAAHPFLPYQAQGGAQAIEDAASLAAVLPTGTTPADVPSRLKLYERQRYDRSSKIQELTRQAGDDREEAPKLDMEKFVAYNIEHDEHKASTWALREHLGIVSSVKGDSVAVA